MTTYKMQVSYGNGATTTPDKTRINFVYAVPRERAEPGTAGAIYRWSPSWKRYGVDRGGMYCEMQAQGKDDADKSLSLQSCEWYQDHGKMEVKRQAWVTLDRDAVRELRAYLAVNFPDDGVTVNADGAIVGPHLVAETFTCGMANGTMEFGWQFQKPDSDDVEFDIVVGVALNAEDAEKRAGPEWEKSAWAARAIVAAAKP